MDKPELAQDGASPEVQDQVTQALRDGRYGTPGVVAGHTGRGAVDPAPGTPEERALDAELALIHPRKWRQVRPTQPQLGCPLCAGNVLHDFRAIRQHVDWHKDQERIRAACGLPPGHVALTVDYAGLAERARRHAHIAAVVAALCMLATGIIIMTLTL